MELLIVNLYVLPQLVSQITTLLPGLLLLFEPNLWGIPLGQVYGSMIGFLFHASSAAIIGYGLVRGKMLKYYLVAVALHIFGYIIRTQFTFGLIGLLVFEALNTVFMVPLFVYVFYKTIWIVKPLEPKISRNRAGKV